MPTTNKRRFFKSSKLWLTILIIFSVVLIAGVWSLRTWYTHNLSPVSSSTQTQYFTVTKGASVHQIAVGLKYDGLIRNSKAFETYVRSKEVNDSLQAGTYALSPSLSVQEIVRKIVNGEVSKNLLTILPGKRLDQIKQIFIKAGYSKSELSQAFNPSTYKDHPALAYLPKGASLEGYIYPDSFLKQANTPAETIIRESLDEMHEHLTQSVVSGFLAQKLSVHQGIIMSSIVYQESGDLESEPKIAQVFLKRLNEGMMLGSDVTAFYASALAGVDNSVYTESPYNTRIHTGLPPGPIGNFTSDALEAVAHPAHTDYLYFVAGDDGTIHFTHTEAEHNAAIKKYCQKACGG